MIDNFVDEYLAGRTPNPCVLCNTHIKWEALIKRADMLDCEFIATGHYANVRLENNRYIVSKGLDVSKDQSYVLWGLSQKNLARTKFPLGKFRKSEIKDMARNWGLIELANKSESYEICFVPDNDYREFLKHRVPGIETKLDGGMFVNASGQILGKHHGYPFYTIGQRKGLEVAFGKPMFVKEILPDTNTVVLCEFDDLKKKEMRVRGLNLIKFPGVDGEMEVTTKIRYKDKGTLSVIKQIDNDHAHISFYEDVNAIAPGQSAVFYDGNDVVGGGFIDRDE